MDEILDPIETASVVDDDKPKIPTLDILEMTTGVQFKVKPVAKMGLPVLVSATVEINRIHL